MKKIAIAALLWSCIVSARIGCLHNSLDLEVKKYDPKEYHPVNCTCPCEAKYVMCPNGKCSECGHRREYVFLQQVKTDPTRLINIAQLRTYGRR